MNCCENEKNYAIKQQTTPVVAFRIKDFPVADIKEIYVIIKAYDVTSSQTLAVRNYPENITLADDVFSFMLTEAETAKFPPDAKVYVDAKVITNSDYVLGVNRLMFDSVKTLFSEGDEANG